MYDYGNSRGLILRKDVEPIRDDYFVGDGIDIYDHRLGYSDGYFHGVINAKFGKANEPSIDYPEVEAYVRGYLAGLDDGFAVATELPSGKLSESETLAFAEGFADGLLDGKNLCN